MKKICLAIGIWLFRAWILWAHNPNEISYFFRLDDQQLVVYLTPSTAIDLLIDLHPELKDNKQFQLAEYSAEFETYFNEKVRLELGNAPIALKLLTADLNQHNGALTFQLKNLPEAWEDYSLSMKSFVHLYKKAKNHVFVYGREQKHHHLLHAQKTMAQGSFAGDKTVSKKPNTMLFSFSLVFALLVVGFAVHRKKQSKA